jgi:hypothetical protein
LPELKSGKTLAGAFKNNFDGNDFLARNQSYQSIKILSYRQFTASLKKVCW